MPHGLGPRARAIGAACVAVLPVAAAAQSPPQQVVRGPVATYWMSADTASGLAAAGSQGGMGAMMGLLSGRGGDAQRTLDLRLGSAQAATGAPQAQHAIPPGMQMGAALPLLTPEAGRERREPDERDLPQGMEQPKGRLLIFWGCGEQAGPGQPVVIDFARVASGQSMPNLVSRGVRQPRGPAPGASRTYGHWPNPTDSRAVPAQASLLGEHAVQGNYSPEIRFRVERHDFMPAVQLTTGARSSAGAQPLAWQSVAGATGYFLAAFGAGAGDAGTDVVMWTSSAVQETGGSLSDYVPPAEVARLIREKVVLAPERTECTVPAEVIRAMPMGMLSFVAYGDELNLVHPPRPQDPKVPWDRQWAVKLRLKSTTLTPLGEGMAGLVGGRSAPARAPADAGQAPATGAAPAAGDAGAASAAGTPPASPTQAIEEGVRQGAQQLMRGLFGR
jgi:hypothetical protein